VIWWIVGAITYFALAVGIGKFLKWRLR